MRNARPLKWTLIIWLHILLLTAGCSVFSNSIKTRATTDPSKPTSPTPSTVQPDLETSALKTIQIPEEIPPVDLSTHTVPLDQIYFDTFRPVNRSVPLSEANHELIENLRDVIPPLHDPRYETTDQASWLQDGDLVLGYASQSGAYAYPLRILNFHEIVNDYLDGEPILISFCPLCYSGIVYSRRLEDKVLTFGNTSALYESDMVMLDYQTGSYWWQIAGEAIVGPLTGQTLTPLPSTTTTWQRWLDLHPNTLVLSRNTGFNRDYNQNPFDQIDAYLNNGNFAFPVSDAALDQRLQPGARILAVKIGVETHGYPLTEGNKSVIMDQIGDQRIAVFIEPQGPSGAAFNPSLGGQRLTFKVVEDQYKDKETGSTWDFSGTSVDGSMKGTQLTALPSRVSFWFAIVAAEPDIELVPPN